MSKKNSLVQKIVLGVAVVALSFSVALPASAQTKGAEGQATTLSPGIICIWFGWC